MPFGWGASKNQHGGNTVEIIAAFRKEIDRQEDILYGVALLFECISTLYAGQEALIETYRKQFRNVIQAGNQAMHQAALLLEAAQKNPAGVNALQSFTFSPCEGYPQPEELQARAIALVESYNQIFPGRSRSAPFTGDETLRLTEAAAARFASLKPSGG